MNETSKPTEIQVPAAESTKQPVTLGQVLQRHEDLLRDLIGRVEALAPCVQCGIVVFLRHANIVLKEIPPQERAKHGGASHAALCGRCSHRNLVVVPKLNGVGL